ncbi:hypothetical protein V6N12_001224 [Hibiscus sabdariffa]|uniref:Legume lectin domain-containing protein n=1 Tax=Hibiscus sabdariffa TaxID=183260 RepID=A0ABR2C6L9_9ROSI
MFLGIEIDARKDEKVGDFNANHVGIDVGSLEPVEVCNLSSLNLVLNNGEPLKSWDIILAMFIYGDLGLGMFRVRCIFFRGSTRNYRSRKKGFLYINILSMVDFRHRSLILDPVYVSDFS